MATSIKSEEYYYESPPAENNIVGDTFEATYGTQENKSAPVVPQQSTNKAPSIMKKSVVNEYDDPYTIDLPKKQVSLVNGYEDSFSSKSGSEVSEPILDKETAQRISNLSEDSDSDFDATPDQIMWKQLCPTEDTDVLSKKMTSTQLRMLLEQRELYGEIDPIIPLAIRKPIRKLYNNWRQVVREIKGETLKYYKVTFPYIWVFLVGCFRIAESVSQSWQLVSENSIKGIYVSDAYVSDRFGDRAINKHYKNELRKKERSSNQVNQM